MQYLCPEYWKSFRRISYRKKAVRRFLERKNVLSRLWGKKPAQAGSGLWKKLYFSAVRNRKMPGNRITAGLCACRYGIAVSNKVIAQRRHERRHIKRWRVDRCRWRLIDSLKIRSADFEAEIIITYLSNYRNRKLHFSLLFALSDILIARNRKYKEHFWCHSNEEWGICEFVYFHISFLTLLILHTASSCHITKKKPP